MDLFYLHESCKLDQLLLCAYERACHRDLFAVECAHRNDRVISGGHAADCHPASCLERDYACLPSCRSNVVYYDVYSACQFRHCAAISDVCERSMTRCAPTRFAILSCHCWKRSLLSLRRQVPLQAVSSPCQRQRPRRRLGATCPSRHRLS